MTLLRRLSSKATAPLTSLEPFSPCRGEPFLPIIPPSPGTSRAFLVAPAVGWFNFTLRRQIRTMSFWLSISPPSQAEQLVQRSRKQRGWMPEVWLTRLIIIRVLSSDSPGGSWFSQASHPRLLGTATPLGVPHSTPGSSACLPRARSSGCSLRGAAFLGSWFPSPHKEDTKMRERSRQ